MKIEIRNGIYSICKSLTVQFVRWMPILCTLFVFVSSVENLYALHYDRFVDLGNEYTIYTPITSIFNRYLYASFYMIVFMEITSITYCFCKYHQVFIVFLFINFMCDEYMKYNLSEEHLYLYFVLISMAAIISIVIALILHQIYGDRKTV